MYHDNNIHNTYYIFDVFTIKWSEPIKMLLYKIKPSVYDSSPAYNSSYKLFLFYIFMYFMNHIIILILILL